MWLIISAILAQQASLIKGGERFDCALIRIIHAGWKAAAGNNGDMFLA
jgi:hypothetical protein